MAVESIFYSVAGMSCRGALIWDEGVKAPRPLLLMAPNWRGVIKPAIETGQMLAGEGYVVFVADMFGEGNGPVGTENPMEFLRPFMSDVAGMRRRVAASSAVMPCEVAGILIEGDVSMLHDVTLGGTGKQGGDRQPKIRYGVMIGAGAKILGNIEVGHCARIAAGSVVVKTVPNNVTVAGVPGKVIGVAGCPEPARTMDQIFHDET